MLTVDRPLLLGSRSPRRQEILADLGIPFRSVSFDVDESPHEGEVPHAYVTRVTRLKMHGLKAEINQRPSAHAGLLVADTSVTLAGRIFGKPRSQSDALNMLGALCGKTHTVLTSYALSAVDSAKTVERQVLTEVTMRRATPSELEAYVATGEGLDKAGAYAVQGKASFLVSRIDGSYSGVVGLPICELVSDLLDLGLLGKFP